MSESITIVVPDELKARIDALSTADGVSSPEWIRDAIQRQVFVRQFRSVRDEMLGELGERGIHLTDEEVFRRVS